MACEYLPGDNQAAENHIAPVSFTLNHSGLKKPFDEPDRQRRQSKNMKQAGIDRARHGKTTEGINHRRHDARPPFPAQTARIAVSRKQRYRKARFLSQCQRPRTCSQQVNPVDWIKHAGLRLREKWRAAVAVRIPQWQLPGPNLFSDELVRR